MKKPIIRNLKKAIDIKGSKEATALALDISVRWVDKILAGQKPSRKVYLKLEKILKG